MKTSQLFVLSSLAIGMAFAGLLLKLKGYPYGEALFIVGAILYVVNRFFFYKSWRKQSQVDEKDIHQGDANEEQIE